MKKKVYHTLAWDFKLLCFQFVVFSLLLPHERGRRNRKATNFIIENLNTLSYSFAMLKFF